VSPRVWYGTTCLLIRIASGKVPCSVVWGRVHGVPVNRVVQEGSLWGNLSIARGASVGETLAKWDILPRVNICNGM
jgi:hypothetical protein